MANRVINGEYGCNVSEFFAKTTKYFLKCYPPEKTVDNDFFKRNICSALNVYAFCC